MLEGKGAELHTTNDLEALAGKYLTFSLMGEEYGVGILKVKEILGMMPITPIPQTLPYLKGVINLRGKITPVVDLRVKFGFPEKEYTPETCIIVVETQGIVMGIIVDTVLEVLDISQANLEPVPPLGRQIQTDFFLGIAKVGEALELLLDIDRILTGGELETLETALVQNR